MFPDGFRIKKNQVKHTRDSYTTDLIGNRTNVSANDITIRYKHVHHFEKFYDQNIAFQFMKNSYKN